MNFGALQDEFLGVKGSEVSSQLTGSITLDYAWIPEGLQDHMCLYESWGAGLCQGEGSKDVSQVPVCPYLLS